MESPSRVDFESMPWEKVEGGGAVGRMKKFAGGGSDTIRLLELDPSWDETGWCRRKHVGLVLSGTLRLALSDGPPLVVREGDAFFIPTGCAHKASCKKVTRLFLVG